MKNYVSDGETVTITAGANYSSGDGVLAGALFGIAMTEIANGATGVIATTGVYELAKTGTQAWAVGALVYWDESAGEATTVAEDNPLIGAAYAAVGSGADDTLGQVRLNGVAGVAAPIAVTDEV